MSICIAINGYKPEHQFNDREKLCLKSLRELRDVSLYNVNNNNVNIDDFDTLHLSYDTKYPFVNKIIDTVVDHVNDNSTVLFINNDIIVKPHLLSMIDEAHDTYMGSRMDVEQQNEGFKPVEYCVHGFDLIGVSTQWWRHNNDMFPNMYLGRPYWDTVYFVLCMQHSNCKIINQHPVSLYHVKHKRVWEHVECEYKTHNEQQVYNIKDFNKWWQYVYGVLLKRPEVDGVENWTPLVDEQHLADQLFKI